MRTDINTRSRQVSAKTAQPAHQSTQKPAAWKIRRISLAITLLTITLCAGVSGEVLVDSTSYVVGPGDKFSIEFFETQIPALEAEVSLEGLARVPAVGSYAIAGMTLAEARAILRAGIKRKYSGVTATISLTTVRNQRALVSGSVTNPGIYEAPATGLVSDIIARAGGLAPGASRRNIVIRSGDKEFPADLEMFTRAGVRAANPPLYLGDVVFVPAASDSTARLHISGEVRAPGAFEFTGRDRISDLIRLGGGLTPQARRDSVRVTDGSGATVWMSLDAPGPLPSGSSVLVAPSQARPRTPGVFIAGEIHVPGRYAYTPWMTAGDLITLAGGRTNRAYLPGATIFNSSLGGALELAPGDPDPVPSAPPARSIDGYSLLATGDGQGNRPPLELLPGDSLVIPERHWTVTVLGQVKAPGVVRYFQERAGATPGSKNEQRLSLGSLLPLAGGATPEADLSQSFVSRRLSGVQIALSADPRIFDGDIVFIARKSKDDRRSALTTLRDVALIGAGVALTVFAIDQVGE